MDIFEDSNFKKVGGTVFNITKSLISHGTKAEITLIAPIANDLYKNEITTDLDNLKVKLIKVGINKTPTETYTKLAKILDVYDLEQTVSVEKFLPQSNMLKEFDVIVADLHFIEVTKLLVKLNPEAKVFIDATSQLMVTRLDNFKPNNMFVKFNRKQASILSNHVLYDSLDFFEVVQILRNKGIEKAFITLDKDGCLFFDKDNQGIIKADVVTNKKYFDAGDSFHAGLIHGFTLSNDLAFMAKTGIEFSAKQIMKEIDANFAKSLESDK